MPIAKEGLFGRSDLANMYFILVEQCRSGANISPCITESIGEHPVYYEVPNCRPGDFLFLDDPNETIVQISIGSQFAILLLQTLQRDKHSNKGFMFKLHQDAFVHICIDIRVESIPVWIYDEGFMHSPATFVTGTSTEYAVYSKLYTASSIVEMKGLELPSHWKNYYNYFILVAQSHDGVDNASMRVESSNIFDTPQSRAFWDEKFGDMSLQKPDFEGKTCVLIDSHMHR